MRKIRPYEEFEENGERLLRIPLNQDQHAVISAKDYNDLRDIGVPARWRLAANGSPVATASAANNGYVLVCRVLLECTANEKVIFLDKDPKNLRRSNIKKVWSPRSDLTDAKSLVLSSNRIAKHGETMVTPA